MSCCEPLRKKDELLKRFIALWEGPNSHYESHYRLVASHNKTYHHRQAMQLLDDVNEELAGERVAP